MSGYLLHEFLPVAEMLNVAEAVIRVFHRLGDYKHKQRNRMKFLIKSLGWDGWRAAYDTAYAEVLAEGGARLPFDPGAPPVETAPDWPRPDAPSLGEVARARGRPRRSSGPGIVPDVRPQPRRGRRKAALRWIRDERAPAEAGRASRPSP